MIEENLTILIGKTTVPSELVNSGISSLLILFLAQKRGQNMAASISLGFGALVGKKGRITGEHEKGGEPSVGLRRETIGAIFTSPLPFSASPFPPPVVYMHV